MNIILGSFSKFTYCLTTCSTWSDWHFIALFIFSHHYNCFNHHRWSFSTNCKGNCISFSDMML